MSDSQDQENVSVIPDSEIIESAPTPWYKTRKTVTFVLGCLGVLLLIILSFSFNKPGKPSLNSAEKSGNSSELIFYPKFDGDRNETPMLMSVKFDGTERANRYDGDELGVIFAVTNDEKTVITLNKTTNSLVSIDLKSKETEDVYIGGDDKIYNFNLSSDGKRISLLTFNQSNIQYQYQIKVIELDEKSKKTIGDVIDIDIKIFNNEIIFYPLVTPNSESLLYFKIHDNGNAFQLCEISLNPHTPNYLKSSCDQKVNGIVRIFSPDGNFYAYMSNDRKIKVVDVKARKIEYEFIYPQKPSYFNSLIIHKWTDDGIYASFFENDSDKYRSLHKFTFADKKCQKVLDKEGNSIETLGQRRRI